MIAIWLGLLPVLPFIPYHQRHDTGEGYAEDAGPHADVAVVAGLRRSAGGRDLRSLDVIADFTGAGLFPVFSGCCLFGDDPFAEGMGFFGDGDLAAAGPFLFVGGLCGRPFLRTGVVRGILFAVLPAAVLTGRLLHAGRGAAGAADRLLVGIVSGADMGVGAVAIGLPLAPVMAERPGFKDRFLGGVLGAQTAGGAGLVVDRLFCAGRGGFQVLFLHGFRREAVCAKLAVFVPAHSADCLCLTCRRTTGTVDGLLMAAVSGADAAMGIVSVGLPFAPVVAENVADLKGFRSLFAADCAGLVVSRLFRAGRGGFQILFFRHFRRKVVRGKLTILLTADRADRFCLTGRRAAGTSDGFLMGCVALTDAAVDTVAV